MPNALDFISKPISSVTPFTAASAPKVNPLSQIATPAPVAPLAPFKTGVTNITPTGTVTAEKAPVATPPSKLASLSTFISKPISSIISGAQNGINTAAQEIQNQQKLSSDTNPLDDEAEQSFFKTGAKPEDFNTAWETALKNNPAIAPKMQAIDNDLTGNGNIDTDPKDIAAERFTQFGSLQKSGTSIPEELQKYYQPQIQKVQSLGDIASKTGTMSNAGPLASPGTMRHQDWIDVLNVIPQAVGKGVFNPILNAASSLSEAATGKPIPSSINIGDATVPIGTVPAFGKDRGNFIDTQSAIQNYMKQVQSGIPEKQAFWSAATDAVGDVASLVFLGEALRAPLKAGVTKFNPSSLINPTKTSFTQQDIFDMLQGVKRPDAVPIPPEAKQAIIDKLGSLDGPAKRKFLGNGVDIMKVKPSTLGRILGVTDEEATNLLGKTYGAEPSGIRTTATAELPGYRERPGQGPAAGLSVRDIEPVGEPGSFKGGQKPKSALDFIKDNPIKGVKPAESFIKDNPSPTLSKSPEIAGGGVKEVPPAVGEGTKAISTPEYSNHEKLLSDNGVGVSNIKSKQFIESPILRDYVSNIESRIPTFEHTKNASPAELASIRDNMQKLRQQIRKSPIPDLIQNPGTHLADSGALENAQAVESQIKTTISKRIENAISQREDYASSRLFNEHGIPEGEYPKGSQKGTESSAVSEEKPAVEVDHATPKTHLKLSREGRPLAYSAREQKILDDKREGLYKQLDRASKSLSAALENPEAHAKAYGRDMIPEYKARIQTINEKLTQFESDEERATNAENLAKAREHVAKMTAEARGKYSKDLVKDPGGQEVTVERKQLATANLRKLLKHQYQVKAPVNIERAGNQLENILMSQPVTEKEFEAMNFEDPIRQAAYPKDDMSTPIKKKIGIHDYFRTPDRVLKKIGLADNMDHLRHSYESYLAELPGHIDLITDWKNAFREASFGGKPKDNDEKLFDYLDGKKITLTPQEEVIGNQIRDYLHEWAERAGLPEDNRITHYITHIFGLEEEPKEFDEDLAKIISDKIPGSVYDPFLEKRLGKKGYLKDPWKALEAYVKRGVRKVNMDPALEGLKKAAERLELSQEKYVKSFADRINLRPTDLDNMLDNSVKQFTQAVGIKNPLGQRPTATVTKFMRQMTYRAFIGLNFKSAIKNLTQGVNTYAILGEKYTGIGYWKMMTEWNNSEMYDNGIFGQDMVQDKTLSAVHKKLETIDKGLFAAFEMAEKINRSSAYWGAKQKALDKGLLEDQAQKYAKKIVRDTQFQFGSIDTPLVLSSDIAKTLGQFGTFGVKQAEFIAERIEKKDWAGLIRYIAATAVIVYLFGEDLNIDASYFVPFWNVLTGKQSIISAPSLALPTAILSALSNKPDDFGNPRSTEKKLFDIGSAIPYPGAIQAQTTFKGLQSLLGPTNTTPVTAGNIAKAAILGKSSIAPATTPSQQGYLDAQKAAASTLSATQTAFKPTYDSIRAQLGEGDTAGANARYNALSASDKKIYNTMKASEIKKNELQNEKDIYATVVKGRGLVAAGKQAQADALYNSLDKDQKKAYDAVKKKFFPNNATNPISPTDAPPPKIATSTPVSTRGVIQTIATYAKAIGTDPITAFDRIFTGQTIKAVDNGTIIVDRMSYADSQAIKKSEGGDNPSMKLDHIVPLEAGGDNSADNLQLIPTAQWSSNTPVENFLAEKLTDGSITGKQSREYAIRFKAGSGETLSPALMKEYKDKYNSEAMTADEVYSSVTSK